MSGSPVLKVPAVVNDQVVEHASTWCTLLAVGQHILTPVWLWELFRAAFLVCGIVQAGVDAPAFNKFKSAEGQQTNPDNGASI